MSSYKFTQRAVASPDAPLKPLVRKRARSGGENWVQVTRRPDSRAKKPRTGGSQQPACAHTEHDILSTTEAAAFAAQFWDKKIHPTKASQHEFLATCIDVDLEQDVKHAGQSSRGHCHPPELQQPGVENRANTEKFGLDAQKYRQLPPPNPCISEMAFSHRFQKVYTYPPLRNEILVLWTKNGENPENTRICSALAYSECPREICGGEGEEEEEEEG